MLKGKGIWINIIGECDGGDIQKIANKCEQAGISYALIKVVEGYSGYNYSGDMDMVKVLTTALREKGIDVVAWGAVYGDSFGAGNWKKEVNRLVRRMNDELKDIKWFILDIESRWRNQHSIASKFMNELLAGLRLDCKLGFSSFRYPEQNPTIPYDEFLPSVHVNMPQLYWEGAQNPIDQLRECIKQYSDRGYSPIDILMVPAGPAYHNRKINWETTPKAMRQFFAEVVAQGFESCTFWDYKNARSTGLWPVIGSMEFPVDPELPAIPDTPVVPHAHPGIKENADAIKDIVEWKTEYNLMALERAEIMKVIVEELEAVKEVIDIEELKVFELGIKQVAILARVDILERKLSVWRWLGRLLRIAQEDTE